MLLDYLGSIFLDERKELGNSILLGDVLEYTLFAFVQTDFATTCTYITVVGICHFARTVDNATHDANLESLQMSSGSFYFCNRLLKVK